MPDPLNPHYDDPAVTYDSGFFYADDVMPAPTLNPTPKRMAKLKLNTSRMSPAQLIALADVVLPKIAPTAPATLPVPNVAAKATSLETKRDAAHAANEAYEAAKAGLPALKVARDAAADALRRAQHRRLRPGSGVAR